MADSTSPAGNIQRRMRYALALASVGTVLIVDMLVVRRNFGTFPPVFIFLGAIVDSVWYGGMGPGLVALALSALAVDYFFLPPLHSLTVYPAWLPYFVAFVLFAF